MAAPHRAAALHAGNRKSLCPPLEAHEEILMKLERNSLNGLFSSEPLLPTPAPLSPLIRRSVVIPANPPGFVPADDSVSDAPATLGGGAAWRERSQEEMLIPC